LPHGIGAALRPPEECPVGAERLEGTDNVALSGGEYTEDRQCLEQSQARHGVCGSIFFSFYRHCVESISRLSNRERKLGHVRKPDGKQKDKHIHKITLNRPDKRILNDVCVWMMVGVQSYRYVCSLLHGILMFAHGFLLFVGDSFCYWSVLFFVSSDAISTGNEQVTNSSTLLSREKTTQ
jgi:hypothetical protein